jgi:hypothetical protein
MIHSLSSEQRPRALPRTYASRRLDAPPPDGLPRARTGRCRLLSAVATPLPRRRGAGNRVECVEGVGVREVGTPREADPVAQNRRLRPPCGDTRAHNGARSLDALVSMVAPTIADLNLAMPVLVADAVVGVGEAHVARRVDRAGDRRRGG